MNNIFPEYIDKVFVFLRPDDSISFILPTINLDYIFLLLVIYSTVSFVFGVIDIFLKNWRNKH